MTTERLKRKLAAILSANVKEYSRLMSQDERGTIRTLTAYKEAMSMLIQEYKGRVVDSPGVSERYHLSSDPAQQRNLIQERRDVAEKIHERLLDFMDRTGTDPSFVAPRVAFRI